MSNASLCASAVFLVVTTRAVQTDGGVTTSALDAEVRAFLDRELALQVEAP